MTKPLALTLGEPAGIGPDIAIAAWMKRRELDLPPFYLLGDRDFMAARAQALGHEIALADATPATAAGIFADALPVVSTGHAVTAQARRPDASSAPAAIASIRQAVADVESGQAGAVVTNPIAKSVLYRAGFEHPGHTEFLAELAAKDGKVPLPVMMLWSPELAVVPVTIHVSLRDAIDQLNGPLITATARIVVGDMKARFGIQRPRLAIAGLNPHAGEDGSMGDEELAFIQHAVTVLQNEGIDARGPLPADTMFHPAARATYDLSLIHI